MRRRAQRRERLVQRDGGGRRVLDAAGPRVSDLPVQVGEAEAGAGGAVRLRHVRVEEEVGVFSGGWVFVGFGGEGEGGCEEGFCGGRE